MKALFLFFALLFATTANAQTLTVLPADYCWGVPIDLNAVSAQDSITVDLPTYEQVCWPTPVTLRAADVDSIGVWCELPDGARLKVGTGVDHNNFTQVDSESLVGPKPYGLYFVPYHVPDYGLHQVANYVVATVTAGSPVVDAVCIATHGQLEVRTPIVTPIDRRRWYNELGIADSIHGVIRH